MKNKCDVGKHFLVWESGMTKLKLVYLNVIKSNCFVKITKKLHCKSEYN